MCPPCCSATLATQTLSNILDHILENLTLTPFTWSLPIEEMLIKRKALRNAALVDVLVRTKCGKVWTSSFCYSGC